MAPIAQPLLLIFALATASTIVGMEIFLFRFDNSQPLKQVFWFRMMLLPLLGAAAYCFVVYSRSNLFSNAFFRASSSPQAAEANSRR
jgi:hypothetical protein